MNIYDYSPSTDAYRAISPLDEFAAQRHAAAQVTDIIRSAFRISSVFFPSAVSRLSEELPKAGIYIGDGGYVERRGPCTIEKKVVFSDVIPCCNLFNEIVKDLSGCETKEVGLEIIESHLHRYASEIAEHENIRPQWDQDYREHNEQWRTREMSELGKLAALLDVTLIP